MAIAAAALFAVAAVLGAVMANRVAQGAPRPLPLALTHGAFAAAGIVLLIVAVTGDAASIVLWSLIVFGVAALGGFVLFGLDRTGRPLPLPMVLGHGAVAVVGFVLLLVGLFG